MSVFQNIALSSCSRALCSTIKYFNYFRMDCPVNLTFMVSKGMSYIDFGDSCTQQISGDLPRRLVCAFLQLFKGEFS